MTRNNLYFNNDFIINKSNRAAASWCCKMATRTLHRGDILFIHGVSPCGKSHLLSSTANLFKITFPDDKVEKKSFRVMIDDYINALKKNSINEFFENYSANKLLLIDDVQWVACMSATQTVFADIFKKLAEGGTDIILFSEMKIDLYDEFFKCLIIEPNFYIAEIKKADIDLRKKYLKKVLSDEGLCLSNRAFRYIVFNRRIKLSSFRGCIAKIQLAKTINKDELDDEKIMCIIKEYIR